MNPFDVQPVVSLLAMIAVQQAILLWTFAFVLTRNRDVQLTPWPPYWLIGCSALAAAAAGEFFPFGQALAISVPLVALIVCAGTDAQLGVLLNWVTVVSIGLSLLVAVAAGTLVTAITGAAALFIGAGLVNVVARRTQGDYLFAWGDVKLAPLVGITLGPIAGATAAAIAVLGCCLVVFHRSRRAAAAPTHVPFAPYLAGASFLQILVGVVLR